MSALPLGAWENFYVTVGSSAGALTSLLFVVITLLAERQEQATRWAVGAFTSPTIVQFGVAFFVAALLSAPWPSLTPPALLLGLASLAGIGYAAIVVRRIQQGIGYQAVGEDWLWFVALPLVADIACFSLRPCSFWAGRNWRCSAPAPRSCCCCSSASATRGIS